MGLVARARASSTSRARPVGMASTRSCATPRDADPAEQAIGVCLGVDVAVMRPRSADLRGGQDVLTRRERTEHLEALERAGDARSRPDVGLGARDVLAVEHDAPAHGVLQARDHVEHGGLAGPVRTDQPGDLAGLHIEVDAAHGRVPAEADGRATHLEQGHVR